jgi:hypothetical protein
MSNARMIKPGLHWGAGSGPAQSGGALLCFVGYTGRGRRDLAAGQASKLPRSAQTTEALDGRAHVSVLSVRTDKGHMAVLYHLG